jgi:hypothetical protein
MNQLKDEILTGKFQWSDIKRRMIEKPGKKKITDKIFPGLVNRGLKQNIVFERKRQPNLIGTP